MGSWSRADEVSNVNEDSVRLEAILVAHWNLLSVFCPCLDVL